MKLRLEIDETGQFIAVDENWKWPRFEGDSCYRLPDTRIPITVNPDGALDDESNFKVLRLSNLDHSYFIHHSVKSCRICGTKFIGGPKSEYCSNQCIQFASADRIKSRHKRKLQNRKCDVCGESLDPQRKTRKFCSNACRQKSHRNAKSKT